MVEALWRFSTSRGVVFGCLDLHGLAVTAFACAQREWLVVVENQ